jgi:phosphoserine phosphatase
MYDIKEMKHSVWVIRRERQQKELTYEKAVAISDSYNDDNVKQSMCSN